MLKTEDGAAKLLERILIIYHDVDQDILQMLEDGLPGRVNDPTAVEKWYKELTINQRNILQEIIKAAVKETLFRLLVLLDNQTGGFPVDDQISDFALYLQSYQGWAELAKNQPQESVRFNSPEDDELHDLLIHLIDSADNA